MGLLTEGSSRPVDMVGLIPVAEAGRQDRKDKNGSMSFDIFGHHSDG